MKKRILRKQLAVFMIYLVFSITIINGFAFAQINDAQDTGTILTPSTQFINATLPSVTNRERYTIIGNTNPGAFVYAYVNNPVGANYDAFKNAGESGNFELEVYLNSPQNTIILLSRDANNNEFTQNYQLALDVKKPIVNIDLPSFAGDRQFSVNYTVDEPVTIIIESKNNDTKTVTLNEAAGQNKKLVLPLEFGLNEVSITFSDIAGNSVVFRDSVYMDDRELAIIEDNIHLLNPSYVQYVKVEGKVNKPNSDVYLFVNGKTKSTSVIPDSILTMAKQGYSAIVGDTDYHAKTDDEGKFSIEVFLDGYERYFQGEQRNIPGNAYEGQYPYAEATTGPRTPYDDRIRTQTTYPNEIKILAIDQSGKSAEKIGTINYEKCSAGGGDWQVTVDPQSISPVAITPEHLRRGFAQISFTMDAKWHGPGRAEDAYITGLRASLIPLNEEERKNYFFDPSAIFGGITAVSSPEGESHYVVVNLNPINYTQKELKDLELDELYLNVPLMFEFTYSYKDPYNPTKNVPKTQRECFSQVKVGLDLEFPEEVIPEKLLEESIKGINQTINVIDDMLEVLRPVMVGAFVVCLFSWVALFAYFVKEKLACQVDEKSCIDATKDRRGLEEKMHYICDRSFCPSAPVVEVWQTNYNFADYKKVNNLDKDAELTDEQIKEEYMWNYDSVCLLSDEYELSKCAMDPKAEGCSPWGNIFSDSSICSATNTNNSKSITTNEKGEESHYIVRGDFVCQADYSKINTGEQTTSNQYSVETSSGTGREKYDCQDSEVPLGYYRESSPANIIKVDNKGIKYIGDAANPKYIGRLPNEPISTQHLFTRNSENPRKYDCIDCGGPLSDLQTTEDKLEKIPKSVNNIRNLPANPVAIDPTSGIINSVKCVCIPAVVGYLELWKQILELVKGCFQSILITKEASSGTCKALLARYLCDLVWDAISCAAKRFSAGYGGDVSADADFGSFFKAVSDAGSGIQDSIRNRYGNTNTFKALFDERKLMHAACLYAFTGEFDLEVESLLTGSTGITLDSEAFMPVSTRRFLSSNPMNNGYTTQVYHVGFGIVAGSDLTYNVKLVCSQTNDCDPEAGFAGGRCDCAGRNAPVEAYLERLPGGGGGRLARGESVGHPDGDVYYLADGSPVRFDRAILEYTYKDNSGNSVTRKIEQEIQLEGNKEPVTCEFYVTSGEFRCQFNVGRTGTARFVGIPALDKEVYAVNEQIQPVIKVEKYSPGYDPQKPLDNNQIPFFLRYRILSGDRLVQDWETYKITNDGVTDVNIKGIPVKATAFIGGANSDDDEFTFDNKISLSEKTTSASAPNYTPIGSNPIAGAVLASSSGFKGLNDLFYFGIYFDNNKDAYYYDAGSIESDKYVVSTASRKKCDDGTCKWEVNNNGGQLKYNGLAILIQDNDVKNNYAFFTFKRLLSASSICEGADNTVKQQEWKMELMLVPCKQADSSIQEVHDYSTQDCTPSERPILSNNIAQQFVGDQAPIFTVVCDEGTPQSISTYQCQRDNLLSEGCYCNDNIKPDCGIGKDNYCTLFDSEYKCTTYVACKKGLEVDELCDCDGLSARDIPSRDAAGMMECNQGQFCNHKGSNMYKCENQAASQ